MEAEVSLLIDKLKARYLAETDQDLARQMGLGRSTVATWRTRGKVPAKYEQIANGEKSRKFYGETPWEFWNEIERAGIELAFLRMKRDLEPITSDYLTFLRKGSEIPTALAEYHSQACADLADKMADEQKLIGDGATARACLQMLAYEEFFER